MDHSTQPRQDNYRLKLDRLEYSGTENCQGVTTRHIRAEMVTELDLEFERDARAFRHTPPVARESYIEYTHTN